MPEAKINGNSLYHIKKYINDNFGQGEWENIIASTDANTRDILSGSILSSAWYDQAVFEALILAFEKIKGREEHVKMVEEKANAMFTGFFGFIVKLVSLNFLLTRMQPLWNKVWTTGRMELVKNENDKNIIVRVSDFDFSDTHMIHIENYLRRILEKSSGQNFKSKGIKKEKAAEFHFSC